MADEPWEGEPVELVDSTSPSTLNFSDRVRAYILKYQLNLCCIRMLKRRRIVFGVLFRREICTALAQSLFSVPRAGSHGCPPFLVRCARLFRDSALHSKGHCCFSYISYPSINTISNFCSHPDPSRFVSIFHFVFEVVSSIFLFRLWMLLLPTCISLTVDGIVMCTLQLFVRSVVF